MIPHHVMPPLYRLYYFIVFAVFNEDDESAAWTEMKEWNGTNDNIGSEW